MLGNNALLPVVSILPGGPAAGDQSAPAASKRHAALQPLRGNRVALGVALATGGMAYAVTAAFAGLASVAVEGNAALRWGPLAAALGALALSYVAAIHMMRLTPARKFMLIWPNLVISAGVCAAPLAASMPAFPWLPWTAALLTGLGWHALSDALLRRFNPVRIGVAGSDHYRISVNGLAMNLEPVAPGATLQGLHGLILMPNPQSSPQWHALSELAALQGRMVVSASAFQQWISGRVPMAEMATDGGIATPSPGYLAVRRLLDMALALVLLAPVMLVIAVTALLIRLDSPGPAIFCQRRVGYRRRPFTCYKLRSMRTDIPGGAFTGCNDPRVTAIGHVIRKFRIDEFPQIFNILRGEMSWIGPRPESVALAAQYRLNIPGYNYRYLVPPGITGWAAVHQGNVGDIDAALTKLEYDLYYIRHVSPAMDLLIAFKTVRVILTGFGSRS